MVGANTLNGIARPGTPPPYITFSIKSAPKYTSSAATPPVNAPTVSEHLNTFAAFLYLLLVKPCRNQL